MKREKLGQDMFERAEATVGILRDMGIKIMFKELEVYRVKLSMILSKRWKEEKGKTKQ